LRPLAVISDSSAVRIDGRQLAQHQAALTVLQRLLSAPGTEHIAWLDLACGRGQILTALRDNLSDDARGRLRFFAYDVRQEYLRESRKTASELGLASEDGDVGDLSKFDKILPAEAKFDFVTLTNTVHEVAPAQLADVLVDAVRRLDARGTLFVYDMERIQPPELGAVPFGADDIRSISQTLVGALTDNDYRPEVSRWRHRTVNGWNVQIQREHIAASDAQIDERRDAAVDATGDAIIAVLEQRRALCQSTLDKLTIYGPETGEEEDDREHLLYEFWAITRALGDRS
jgi:SAM-dependent methyltransferase